MNLCKFGIHDYQIIYERDIVYKTISKWLEQQGYMYYYNHFYNDKISITDSSFYESGQYTKVCLRCGKTKSNYNIDKIKEKVYSLIKDKLLVYEREQKAKEILNDSR